MVANAETPIIQIEKAEGNIHSFKAGKEGCVFLDLFIPPYEPPARDATYFKIICEGEEAKKQAAHTLSEERAKEVLEKVDTILAVGSLPNFPISLEDYVGIKPFNW